MARPENNEIISPRLLCKANAALMLFGHSLLLCAHFRLYLNFNNVEELFFFMRAVCERFFTSNAFNRGNIAGKIFARFFLSPKYRIFKQSSDDLHDKTLPHAFVVHMKYCHSLILK